MLPRRHFPWIELYAVLMLLFVQSFLASHEVEHLDQDHGESCEIYLLGTSHDGSLPPSWPIPGAGVPLGDYEPAAYLGT